MKDMKQLWVRDKLKRRKDNKIFEIFSISIDHGKTYYNIWQYEGRQKYVISEDQLNRFDRMIDR